MTNLEIIKMLVDSIEVQGAQNEALKTAAIELLGNIKTTPKPSVPSKEDKPSKETKPKGRGGRKSTIDWPKVEALKDAGWTHQAIAEEVGCSTVTIGKHFMKGGAA